LSWDLVVHAGNLSYLGGRDLEDHNRKPAQIVPETITQITFHKNKAGGGPELKPQYQKKKKKKPSYHTHGNT
jgi:hypothetical protein